MTPKSKEFSSESKAAKLFSKPSKTFCYYSYTLSWTTTAKKKKSALRERSQTFVFSESEVMEGDVCLPTTPGCTFSPALIWSCALEPSWMCILSGLENIVRTPGCDTFNLIGEQFPLLIHLRSAIRAPTEHEWQHTASLLRWAVGSTAPPQQPRGSAVSIFKSVPLHIPFDCLTRPCWKLGLKKTLFQFFSFFQKGHLIDVDGQCPSVRKHHHRGKDWLSCAAARLHPQHKPLAPQRVKHQRRRATLHEPLGWILPNKAHKKWIYWSVCYPGTFQNNTNAWLMSSPSTGTSTGHKGATLNTFTLEDALSVLNFARCSSYQLLHKISNEVIW